MMRALVAGIGAGTVVAMFAIALASLGKSRPEFKPPRPSGGNWASEAEIGPLDLVPDAPSPFAPISTADPSTTTQSTP
jgi:hypothetical protein